MLQAARKGGFFFRTVSLIQGIMRAVRAKSGSRE